jgi:protein XagA
MRMKNIFAVVVCLHFCTPLMAGGGWPQPRRGGYFKLAQNYIRSPYFFAPDGSIVDITTVQLFTSSIYGEYGITSKLTGLVYFPFFVRNTFNEVRYNQSGIVLPGDSFQSVGDTDVALKYSFRTDKNIVMAGTLLLLLGRPSGGAGMILQTGDGEFNQMIRIDASTSFYPNPVYASIYAAFNNRTKNFSDEIRFGAEVGLTLKKFIPILKLNVVQSLFNGDAEAVQNGIFSNNTEYISPTVEVNYQASDKWGLSASGGFAFAGRNILAAPNWSLGLYLKLEGK